MPGLTLPTIFRGGKRQMPLAAKPAHKRHNPRPQRLHTWFNLIPVEELRRTQPERIAFLDTFVTVETRQSGSETAYTVLFEGVQQMTAVVQVGVIFVWYGENLAEPDRPFPKLYDQLYDSEYVTSAVSLFDDTHVMDFVENGSDNLHFKAVHLWEYSKIYDHEVTDETITLKQDTRFHYGKCSTRRSVRLLSRILPRLELTQDYVYHGPALAVVGAQGKGSPEMHALVSLTPEGAYRTRVYVTIAIAPGTFPAWAERAFGWVSPKRTLRQSSNQLPGSTLSGAEPSASVPRAPAVMSLLDLIANSALFGSPLRQGGAELL